MANVWGWLWTPVEGKGRRVLLLKVYSKQASMGGEQASICQCVHVERYYGSGDQLWKHQHVLFNS